MLTPDAAHRIISLNPKYVFRGTTHRHPGNRGSQIIPYTCTSANPYKAALFASFCRNNYPDPVVYIAQTDSLPFTVLQEGSHGQSEEEIAWSVAPVEFYTHTMGWVTLDEMQNILRLHGYDIPASVSRPYISEKCDAMPAMDIIVIQRIVTEALNFIKSP